MALYQRTVNVKAGLFGLGMVLVISLLWYSQSLTRDLQANQRRLLDIYAHLIARAATADNQADIGFIFEEVIQQIQFPMIITSDDGIPVSWRNIDIPSDAVGADVEAAVTRIVSRMDAQNAPLEVAYQDIVISRIHYGDSSLVSQLRWLPIVEICLAGLFILLGFLGFTSIRNNEKRSIWVGMARETAHQLGTPVSSLMGWVQILRDKSTLDHALLDELDSDVKRLEQIADRFHKIGSLPKFEEYDLLALAEASANYFRSRLPSKSSTVITVEGESAFVDCAETLLQWALENLLKNSLDACQGKDGIIRIVVMTSADQPSTCSIEITDNGVGISARHRKNIFRPGYSTKKRGWGLGLSLTKRIVTEIHKGQLRLVSSRPGETIIRMTFRASPTDTA